MKAKRRTPSSSGRKKSNESDSVEEFNGYCASCDGRLLTDSDQSTCVKCAGVYHTKCEPLSSSLVCSICMSKSRKARSRSREKLEKNPKKKKENLIEEVEDLCPVCEEVCTCKKSTPVKKHRPKPVQSEEDDDEEEQIKRARTESILSTYSLSSDLSSLSPSHVLSEIAMMEDPVDSIHLLWSSEDEHLIDVPQRKPKAEEDILEEDLLGAIVLDTNDNLPNNSVAANSTTKRKVESPKKEIKKSVVAPAPALNAQALLNGMSKEKLIATLSTLPNHLMVQLGESAKKELSTWKVGTYPAIPNRPLTRTEYIQLIMLVLGPKTQKPMIPTSSLKKPMATKPTNNTSAGTLCKGTRLVSNANDVDLRISIEKALYESSDEEDDHADGLAMNVDEVLISVEGSSSKEVLPQLERFEKIPIGAFRRSRRPSAPFLALSKALKTSVLQNASKSNQSSIHSLLTPTVAGPYSSMPNSPVFSPLVTHGSNLIDDSPPSACASPNPVKSTDLFLSNDLLSPSLFVRNIERDPPNLQLTPTMFEKK